MVLPRLMAIALVLVVLGLAVSRLRTGQVAKGELAQRLGVMSRQHQAASVAGLEAPGDARGDRG